MIDLDNIPLSSAVRRLIDKDGDRWEKVLTGGDDYEIVFTARNQSCVAEISDKLNLPITPIGRIVSGTAVEILNSRGEAIAFEDAGYKHV